MTKVTMGKAPSPKQQVVAAANANREVVDSNGRKIVVRRVTSLDTMRLYKAVGPALSENRPYMLLASMAQSVVSIDGEMIPPMLTERAIEARITQLGDEGVAALVSQARSDAEEAMSDKEVALAAENFTEAQNSGSAPSST